MTERKPYFRFAGNRKSGRNTRASPTPCHAFGKACLDWRVDCDGLVVDYYSSLFPDFSRLQCDGQFRNARELYRWWSEPGQNGSNSNASTEITPRPSKVQENVSHAWAFLCLIKLNGFRFFLLRCSMFLMLKFVFFYTEEWFHSDAGRGKTRKWSWVQRNRLTFKNLEVSANILCQLF